MASRTLPPAVSVRLPAVLATMHMFWGAGFLTSPRGLMPARRRSMSREPGDYRV